MASDDVRREVGELVSRNAFDHQFAFFERRQESSLDRSRTAQCREELAHLHGTDTGTLGPVRGVSQPRFVRFAKLEQQRWCIVVVASADRVHDSLKKHL